MRAQKAHWFQLAETDVMPVPVSFFFPQIVTTSQYFQQIEHETDIPFCG